MSSQFSESYKNAAEEDVEEKDKEGNDEDDQITGVEDIDGNSRSGKNTDTGRGSAEWLRLLSPSAQTEALRAMAKAKAS